MTLFINISKEDLKKLKGFIPESTKTIYEEARLAKQGATLILYASGKLLVQGKKEVVAKIASELKKLHFQEEEKTAFRKETGIIIGTDEVLKGDTFGGLVVAGVKADETTRQRLLELGVKDSKLLADKEILLLAEKIKQIAPCEIRSLLPEEYNKEHNQTQLLNQLHKECAEYLKPGKHIVDQFPGCTVGAVITEQAESKYVEVAAASVIARATGLKQLNYLSALAGFDLPKGSTHVQEALLRLFGKHVAMEKFVKMDFRNVKRVLESKN
ncbi:hypothetical protein J4421_02100 [Candidatus Woesearchaeota archaeon]|nr:hypothetical protein [Candidatus Woesearchaeota archaeon]